MNQNSFVRTLVTEPSLIALAGVGGGKCGNPTPVPVLPTRARCPGNTGTADVTGGALGGVA